MCEKYGDAEKTCMGVHFYCQKAHFILDICQALRYAICQVVNSVRLKGKIMEEKTWDAFTIRELRANLGLTQKEFAEKIGVVERTIIRWEDYGNKHQPLIMAKRRFNQLASKLGAKPCK